MHLVINLPTATMSQSEGRTAMTAHSAHNAYSFGNFAEPPDWDGVLQMGLIGTPLYWHILRKKMIVTIILPLSMQCWDEYGDSGCAIS